MTLFRKALIICGVGSDHTTDMPELPDRIMDLSFGETDLSSPKAFSSGLPEFNMFPDTMPTFDTKMEKVSKVDKFMNSMYETEWWPPLIAKFS